MHDGAFGLTAIITAGAGRSRPRLQGRGVKPPVALIRG